MAHSDEALLLVRAERDRYKRMLIFIGGQLPSMLELMQWGAFKGALLEDGTIKAAIQMAEAAKEEATSASDSD